MIPGTPKKLRKPKKPRNHVFLTVFILVSIADVVYNLKV